MGALPPQEWLWGHAWVPLSPAPWGGGMAWQHQGGQWGQIWPRRTAVHRSVPPRVPAPGCADVGFPVGALVHISMCTHVCMPVSPKPTRVHAHTRAAPPHARGLHPRAPTFTYPRLCPRVCTHTGPSPHARGLARLCQGTLLSPVEAQGVPALPPPRAHAWLRGEQGGGSCFIGG